MLDAFHPGHAALAFQPFQGQAQHIDAPAGRRVIHGVLFDHLIITEHQRGIRQVVTGQSLVDDDDGQTGRRQVLLSACVDDAILGHIHHTAGNVRGHIAHQGHVTGFGDVLPLRAIDGVICAVIKVACLRIQLQFTLGGNIGVVPVGRGGGQIDLAVLLSFFVSDVGKVAGHRIVRFACLADQVHGDGGELGGSAALEEQDLIILRNIHQTAEPLLGLVKNVLEYLGAMTHLHDGHPTAVVIGDLGTCFLQHLQRKHGRACGKIINTISHSERSPF